MRIKTDRNTAILILWRKKWSYGKIAGVFDGVTRQRVHQIIKEEIARRSPKKVIHKRTVDAKSGGGKV